MRIEVETGKPGRVLVLSIPNVGKDAVQAGAAVAVCVAAGSELMVQSLELLRDEIRLRTTSEADELYQQGQALERRVHDTVKAANLPRRTRP